MIKININLSNDTITLINYYVFSCYILKKSNSIYIIKSIIYYCFNSKNND